MPESVEIIKQARSTVITYFQWLWSEGDRVVTTVDPADNKFYSGGTYTHWAWASFRRWRRTDAAYHHQSSRDLNEEVTSKTKMIMMEKVFEKSLKQLMNQWRKQESNYQNPADL